LSTNPCAKAATGPKARTALVANVTRIFMSGLLWWDYSGMRTLHAAYLMPSVIARDTILSACNL
jgi:hypothetical protein